ncbi:hypothetical protein [Halomonas ramblicola]|uniref:hypothetical protein n=1 Tax=Halomonas ramblicola TaxID=747349 RepID=UPI0025B5F5A7|nr:hypothetical protein [Halomonas ramblicola]MDN3522619.1 hypothetical protein [Halomonas ramblicola]
MIVKDHCRHMKKQHGHQSVEAEEQARGSDPAAGVPSDSVTFEAATWPTTSPAHSATSDTLSAPAARSARTICCSV